MPSKKVHASLAALVVLGCCLDLADSYAEHGLTRTQSLRRPIYESSMLPYHKGKKISYDSHDLMAWCTSPRSHHMETHLYTELAAPPSTDSSAGHHGFLFTFSLHCWLTCTGSMIHG